MKKYFLLLTLLCLSLSARAHDAEVDGIFYNLDADNKTATVTFQGDNYDSYNNEYSGDVVIPETVTYKGITYSVTSLGDDCFSGCSSLQIVNLAEYDKLEKIGNGAFYDCDNLKEITFPKSITTLGEEFFSGCKKVETVDLSECTKLEVIGNN